MQSLSWQQQLANAISTPDQLLQFVGLEASRIGYSKQGVQQFPVRVPMSFAKRIRREDPDDPILRQVFPYPEETLDKQDFSQDPLNEQQLQPVPGLLHKYKNRVLSVTTGACAIHCRYCFRRHFPYQQASTSLQHWQASISHIKADPEIDEVILSGGDPLSLADDKLIRLCESIAAMKHVKRIRFHTRFPVVLPDRLTPAFLARIARLDKQIIMVLHINHANEIDQAVKDNIDRLRQLQIMVLNQSVLLKGINDNVDSLVDLSDKLVQAGVIPYYLHLLDPVSGASHYDVSADKANEIICRMRETVSGYMVPTLVREEIGKPYKTPMEKST